MKNYICFGGRFRIRYAYLDTHSYIADSIFYKHEIPVRFEDEFVKDGEKYRVIFCSVKRKYKAKFERALLEIHNKMLLCGYNDYEDSCKEFVNCGKIDEE